MADGTIGSVLLKRNLSYQIVAPPQNLPSHLIIRIELQLLRPRDSRVLEWDGSGTRVECHFSKEVDFSKYILMGNCHYKGTMGKFWFTWGTIPSPLRANTDGWGAALLSAACSVCVSYPCCSCSWPLLSTRQRLPRWGSSIMSVRRSWTGGEVLSVSTCVGTL